MAKPIDRAAAVQLILRHLGESLRASHSVQVGHIMRCLATVLDEDTELWEVTGLCHDLDFEVTADDRSRHGLVTVEWLHGRLPDHALMAIAAHDHRTGISSETRIATALKLADALAVAAEMLGVDAVSALKSPPVALEARLSERPYLHGLLTRSATQLGVSLPGLAAMLEGTWPIQGDDAADRGPVDGPRPSTGSG